MPKCLNEVNAAARQLGEVMDTLDKAGKGITLKEYTKAVKAIAALQIKAFAATETAIEALRWQALSDESQQVALASFAKSFHKEMRRAIDSASWGAEDMAEVVQSMVDNGGEDYQQTRPEFFSNAPLR